MRNMDCSEAKKIGLVSYLESLGIHPAKVCGENYWYLSPLHMEYVPSFKINRVRNLWYDFSLGRGGSIIDLGTEMFLCTVPEFLQKLAKQQAIFSFRQHEKKELSEKKPGDSQIKIISTGPVVSTYLLDYLDERAIPHSITKSYLKEVNFQIKDRQHLAIGFQNKSGDYELRNPYFKGSSSPKDISFLDNGTDKIAVFEGFFSFLSYIDFREKHTLGMTNFLVLNSLSFFKKVKPVMEIHGKIYLFLDNDDAGIRCKNQVLYGDPKYQDCSGLYKDHKDINDWQRQVRAHQKNDTRCNRRIRR